MSEEEIIIVARAIDPMAWSAHAYGTQDINLYGILAMRREKSKDVACVALVALDRHRREKATDTPASPSQT